MVSKAINLKTLNLEELAGVVTLYPWYGGARMELCRRMSSLGDGAWGEDRYADMALYVSCRRMVSDLVRKSYGADYSDENISELLRVWFEPKASPEVPEVEVAEPENAPELPAAEQPRRVYIAGGDYFSRSQYDSVRRDGDNIFSSFARSEAHLPAEPQQEDDMSAFFTETLAQVYLEQGYIEQARDIYAKLSLRYPEKSVYFASLIEKLDK